jgi:TolC family type I secretion outer membrane protein
MKQAFTLFFLVGLVVLETVQAVELPSDRPLTLQDCISYALEHHDSIQAARYEVTASFAETRRAKAGYLPQMILTSRHVRSGSDVEAFRRISDPGSEEFISAPAGTHTDDRVAFTITENLYDGGRTRMTIRQAVASEKASRAELEAVIQERILAVTQAYFEALLAQKLADIAGQAVDEAQKQYDMVKNRIEAGDVAPVDIYPVEVQLANARLKKLQADNNARIAASGLRNAIGLTRGPALRVVDVSEPPSDFIPSLEDCINYAIAHRPEIERITAQLEAAEAALWYAKSQVSPVPTVELSYDRGLVGSDSGSEWSVLLGLSLTVFDGGATKAEIDNARAQLKSLQYTAERMQKDIEAEVEEAYLSLTDALERLSASKANVELAKTNLDVMNAKYEQGLAIPLEVVSAQVSYADAQAAYAQALYDCYIARAKLNKAIGKRG